MNAKDIINNNILTLKPNDSVEKALNIIADSRLSQLPFIENNKFVGIFTDDLLHNFDFDTLLKDVPFLKVEQSIPAEMPILEVVKNFESSDFDILPVYDLNNNWLGTLDRKSTQNHFINQFELKSPGAIIEIVTPENNYSLFEISRIIENEDTKITFMLSKSTIIDQKPHLILSLKVNKTQISRVVNALERHGYEVSSYFSTEQVDNLEKDRYDLLMKYLSI